MLGPNSVSDWPATIPCLQIGHHSGCERRKCAYRNEIIAHHPAYDLRKGVYRIENIGHQPACDLRKRVNRFENKFQWPSHLRHYQRECIGLKILGVIFEGTSVELKILAIILRVTFKRVSIEL
jgi:hypothetical protein